MLFGHSGQQTGLSFTTAAGPRQCSHSQVRVPRNSWPYFTASDSRLSPTWGARSPYLIPPPRTAWPSYTPRHWVPFSSPPKSRRATVATVEVFELASTRSPARHVLPLLQTATRKKGQPPLSTERARSMFTAAIRMMHAVNGDYFVRQCVKDS
jgi:hypothetical protein